MKFLKELLEGKQIRHQIAAKKKQEKKSRKDLNYKLKDKNLPAMLKKQHNPFDDSEYKDDPTHTPAFLKRQSN